MAKEGSTISGFADAFAQAISYALQYGVPLQALVDKFSHVRFEPSGMTKNPEIRFAKSIVDYIFRWMATKFLSPRRSSAPAYNSPKAPRASATSSSTSSQRSRSTLTTTSHPHSSGRRWTCCVTCRSARALAFTAWWRRIGSSSPAIASE
jgi:hypothetical protein